MSCSVYIYMFAVVYVCDPPAGMIFVPYTKVRTLLQRNDLCSPSPENDSLLQSFEVARLRLRRPFGKAISGRQTA